MQSSSTLRKARPKDNISLATIDHETPWFTYTPELRIPGAHTIRVSLREIAGYH